MESNLRLQLLNPKRNQVRREMKTAISPHLLRIVGSSLIISRILGRCFTSNTGYKTRKMATRGNYSLKRALMAFAFSKSHRA